MANGKGAIEKRDKEGYSWRLEVSCGYDKNGKKNRERKTVRVEGRTFESRRKAAERELALFLAEVEKGNYLHPSKLTFEEYAEQWGKNYLEQKLQPRTVVCYKQFLRDRIVPALGHLKLQDIKPMHIVKFYANLQEPGIREDGRPGTLSTATIKKYHAVLSSMFERAVKWELITSNPVASGKVEAPKVKQKEMQCFDTEKASLLLSALENEPLKYRLIVTLALASGCRRGEIMALQWKHVDLKNSTIFIKYSLQCLKGQEPSLKEPKNKSSVRMISIPGFVVDMLKEHQKQQKENRLLAGTEWQKDSDYVFTQWNGKVMHLDTISQWFPDFLKRYNKSVDGNKDLTDEQKGALLLPVVNFHMLRHTAATLLIDKGLNVKAVSARLGHAQTSTTTNIYAHALHTADKQAANIIEELFKKPNNESQKTASN